MDVLQYRDTGEFSDLSVHIGDKLFKLHRLPLLIRCRFIKERLTEQVNELNLNDLPGGAEIFSLIADFCYGKRVNYAVENIVALRCAAEQLLMEGDDNLISITRRLMDQWIHSATMSRSLEPVVDMIVHGCQHLVLSTADEKEEKNSTPNPVLQACFEALLDLWSRAFSRSPSNESVSDFMADRLLKIPLKTLGQFFVGKIEKSEETVNQPKQPVDAPATVPEEDPSTTKVAEDKESNETEEKDNKAKVVAISDPPSGRTVILTDVAVRFLGRVLRLDENQRENQKKDNSQEDKPDLKKVDEKDEDETEKEKNDKPYEAEVEQSAIVEDKTKSSDSASSAPSTSPPSLLQHSAAEYLDKIVEALPDNAPLAEIISASWLHQALEVADKEKENLKCRPRLIQLAAVVIDRLTPQQQRHLPPGIICEIIAAAQSNISPNTLACVLDNHMKQLAQQGDLNMDSLLDLVKSLPEKERILHHDNVFELLEQLAQSGKEMAEEKLNELLDIVDLSHCSVDNLQKALDKNIIPLNKLCQASISLARRLDSTNSTNSWKNDYKNPYKNNSFATEDPIRLRPAVHQVPNRSTPFSLASSSTTPKYQPFNNTTSAYISSGRPAVEPFIGSGLPISDTFNDSASMSYSLSARTTTMPTTYSSPPISHGNAPFYGDNYGVNITRSYDYDNNSRYDSWKKGFDDFSLQAFEESLRGELNRISMNYDSYFREKESRPPRRQPHFRQPPSTYGWK